MTMKLTNFVLLMLMGAIWRGTRVRGQCYVEEPARYSLTFQTFWTSENFPKQYPRYRPNAQWSKLIGRSHSGGYKLWSLGELAKPGVKLFAHDGRSKELDDEAQGYHGILDTFYTPSIPIGSGNASVQFTVDSQHPKISVMSRLIPSPDWFVGLDSIDMCDGHAWRSSVNLDLDPIDAGTDRGFTFTSPNWEAIPQQPISRISASFPTHPAGSFHYGAGHTLPTIARVSIKRVIATDEGSSSSEESSGDSSSSEEQEGFLLERHHQESRDKDMYLRRESTRPTEILNEVENSGEVKHNTPNDPNINMLNGKKGRKPRNKDHTSKKKIRPSSESKNGMRKSKSTRIGAQTQTDRTTDCLVSQWAKFAECSKTCGYGVRVRTRHVMRERGPRGAPCPPLQEKETCGTMKGCGWSHFSFLQNDGED